MVQGIINAVIQVILFTLIPLIWWSVTARKECSFFQWIGLKKINSENKKQTAVWTAIVTAAFLAVSFFTLMMLKNVEMATSDFAGKGLSALPAILVYAIVQTSLAEEILFRGFLLKRFAKKFGDNTGITVQAVLFGVMHGAMFFSKVGAAKAVLIIALTGGIGWFMGYINEKKANGSILPGWCIHACANIFSGLLSACVFYN